MPPANRQKRAPVAPDSLQVLVDAAPDAMVVVDGKGIIQVINLQTTDLFGYEAEDLVGEPVEVLVPEALRERHVGHREGYMDEPRVRPMGADLDLQALRKDGKKVPVEISLSPLETTEGTMVVAAVRDITERRGAEEQFKALLESAPDGMVIVDRSGTIVRVNAQAETLFQYDRDELVGRKVEVLIPGRFHDAHPGHRNHFFEDPKLRPMGAGLDLWARRKDGSEFPVEISLSPIKTDTGMLATAAVRDMTDRREQQEQLRRSLAQKDVLIQEVHHRVKNNLQVISSMLNLQSDLVEDPAARDPLQESRHRIRSMALVHEKLYRSDNLEQVDARDYIAELVRGLRLSYESQQVQIKLELEPIDMDLDTAIACGLIVNELVSNAFKHAFPTGQGTVQVGLERRAGHITLRVQDDGVGLPEDFDPGRTESLGMQLVATLTGQLDGKMDFSAKKGSSFIITFPPKEEA